MYGQNCKLYSHKSFEQILKRKTKHFFFSLQPSYYRILQSKLVHLHLCLLPRPFHWVHHQSNGFLDVPWPTSIQSWRHIQYHLCQKLEKPKIYVLNISREKASKQNKNSLPRISIKIVQYYCMIWMQAVTR